MAQQQSRLGSLPLPIKLANLQQELTAARQQLQDGNFDTKIADASSALERAHEEYGALQKRAQELRGRRNRLAAASEGATRLRVAQEDLEKHQAEVRPSALLSRRSHARQILLLRNSI